MWVAISFNAPELELDEWVGHNRNAPVPVYETNAASLEILLMKPDLSTEQRQELEKFAKRMVQFALLLGGFGKSWRRADHRLVMPRYRNQMIGCHWEFLPPSYSYYVPRSLRVSLCDRISVRLGRREMCKFGGGWRKRLKIV
jgi:CRISPR-associated protein Cmr6